MTDTRDAALGWYVANARQEKDWNQEMLAQAIGMSRAALANIERGRQRLYWNQLCDIAKVLERPVTDFVTHAEKSSS